MVVLLLIFWPIKVLISIEAKSLYISTKQYAVVTFLHTCWWSFWHILRYGDRCYDFVSSPFLHRSPSFSSFLTSLYLTLSVLSSPYFLSSLVLSSFLLPLSLLGSPLPSLSLPLTTPTHLRIIHLASIALRNAWECQGNTLYEDVPEAKTMTEKWLERWTKTSPLDTSHE